MQCRRRTLVVLTLALLIGASGQVRAGGPDFPSPESLRPQVEFWKKIFGVYSEHQILIHDTEDLRRVYAVLDYRDRVAAGEGRIALEVRQKREVPAEKERIRALLLGLRGKSADAGSLSPEERKIRRLFTGAHAARELAAAADPARIRHQRGLKERFGEGVRISRSYLAEMEEIFRQEGLPLELTRLPLVESCFDIDAYSKVGAAGIWQFMPATGREYLRIGGVVDERRDPLRATRGAARHLKENYQALGTWPLAITAYNHGRGGVLRAVRETGTKDIAAIIARYRGPRFGFASRNFYPEFLAALEVERDHRDYFGELAFAPPFVGDEVRLARALSGRDAVRCAEISPAELAALNPAVQRDVFHRGGHLPAGYVLRVPHGRAAAFRERVARLAPATRVAASGSTARGGTHRVAQGQTLSHIARRYGVSVASLRHANRLSGTTIRAGEVLEIPGGAAGGDRVAAAERRVGAKSGASYRTHRVAKGQTLSHLARRYRVTVDQIKRANGLRSTTVRAGQVLRIPTG
jgi:membrane-bound lytic murein transglycosylase D